MSKREQVIEKTLAILKDSPKGIRYSVLARKICEALPDISKNTVHGTIWNLDVKLPDKVLKPARGIWLHADYKSGDGSVNNIAVVSSRKKVAESDFYEAFADWIVTELEECTKAIPVGGNVFKDKWGTPDVIGIREPRKSDIVKFLTEIISAEIKVDSSSLITAFGQACSYRLFSHKSYIVVPANSPEEDVARLDTLSRIFGIGFILFNSDEPDKPNFEIRVRAANHEPDMFYVNRYLKLVEDRLFS